MWGCQKPLITDILPGKVHSLHDATLLLLTFAIAGHDCGLVIVAGALKTLDNALPESTDIDRRHITLCLCLSPTRR